MSEVRELVDMPDTDAPNMAYIRFAIPQPLLNEALELAKSEGWKPSELHRIFWERGFAAYAEGSNKRKVNKRLRNNEAEE